MATKTAFHPQILLNTASVASFLNGERETAEIVRYTSQPPKIGGEQHSELYYYVSSILLTLASYLLHVVCFSGLSKRTWIMSRHAMADATAIKTQKVFQQNLLIRSINTHREDTADYYLQRPQHIPYLTYPNPNIMNFFHSDGLCKGMCYWFASLYFKTEGRVTDPKQHVIGVAQQFAKGAPAQAAFLQSLDNKPIYDLLQLQVHEDNSKITVTGKTREQICREFQCRCPGVYGIITSSHFLIYIKINDNDQYLFDPTKGCICISSIDLFKKAMDSYFDSHDNTKEISVDWFSHR